MSPKALLRLLILTLTLPAVLSFAGDNSVAIEPVFPAGSASYFVVLNVWSDSAPDVDMIPVDLKNARQLRRVFNQVNRRPAPATPLLPVAQDARPTPLGTYVANFTATVWNTGRIESTRPQLLTEDQLLAMIDRLEAESEPERPREIRVVMTPAPATPSRNSQATPTGNYPPSDQCHARKTDGNRCSRASKGISGFCWQHQQSADAYPNR
jgi:hypothetical protein